MKPAIRVENLSKQYRLGVRGQDHYHTLRESLASAFKSPLRQFRRNQVPPKNEGDFWALKDVSFDVQPGEVIGIIGRNGAGKSTLLKILSRIIEPTLGRAVLCGRIGSLLEVGTGFHPELTGRENIYLNGAILGMKRREIDQKFNEIVAFSEVEKFLDTPVKRYSSGMYVRLAFAVAANLEPEILMVDEVLAVGDAAFQRRCLSKLKNVARSGRTVLLTSHNMAAIQHLSTMVLYLQTGAPAKFLDTQDGIQLYMAAANQFQGVELDLRKHPNRRKNCPPILRHVRLLNGRNELKQAVFCGESLIIEIEVLPDRPLENPQFGIGIDDQLGNRLFSFATYLSSCQLPTIDRFTRVRCAIDCLLLAPGKYTLSLSAGTTYNSLIDALDQAFTIEIEPADFYQNGRMPNSSLGSVLAKSSWAVASH